MPLSCAIFFANGLANTLPPDATVGDGVGGETAATGGGGGGVCIGGGGGRVSVGGAGGISASEGFSLRK